MSDGTNPYAPPDARPFAPTPAPPPSAKTGLRGASVAIDVTADDLADSAAFHQIRSTAGRRGIRASRVMFAIYLAVVATYALQIAMDQHRIDGFYAGMSIVVLSLIAVYPRILAHLARRSVRRALVDSPSLGMLGPRLVTLTPEAVRSEGPYTDERFRWTAIERVLESENHLYFYIASARSHVIPRRAFASDAEFEAFVALARRYQAAAQDA